MATIIENDLGLTAEDFTPEDMAFFQDYMNKQRDIMSSSPTTVSPEEDMLTERYFQVMDAALARKEANAAAGAPSVQQVAKERAVQKTTAGPDPLGLAVDDQALTGLDEFGSPDPRFLLDEMVIRKPKEVAARRILESDPMLATAPSGAEDEAFIDEMLGSGSMTMGQMARNPRPPVIQARRGGMMDLVGTGQEAELGNRGQGDIVDNLVRSRKDINANRAKSLTSEMYQDSLNQEFPPAPSDPLGLAYIRNASATARDNQDILNEMKGITSDMYQDDLQKNIDADNLKEMKEISSLMYQDDLEKSVDADTTRMAKNLTSEMYQDDLNKPLSEVYPDIAGRIAGRGSGNTETQQGSKDKAVEQISQGRKTADNVVELMMADQNKAKEFLQLMPSIDLLRSQLSKAGSPDTRLADLERRVKTSASASDLFSLDADVRNFGRGVAESRALGGVSDALKAGTDVAAKHLELESGKPAQRKTIAKEMFEAFESPELLSYGDDYAEYIAERPEVRLEYSSALKNAKAKAKLASEKDISNKQAYLKFIGDIDEQQARIKKLEAEAKKAGKTGKGKSNLKRNVDIAKDILTKAQAGPKAKQSFHEGQIRALIQSGEAYKEVNKTVLDEHRTGMKEAEAALKAISRLQAQAARDLARGKEPKDVFNALSNNLKGSSAQVVGYKQN